MVGGLAAVATVATAVGLTFGGDDTVTVTGTVTLPHVTTDTTIGECAGAGEQATITPTTRVALYDAAGTPLASDRLGAGVDTGSTCVFRFALDGVPRDHAPYRLDVAGHSTTVTEAGTEALTLVLD
ncbi:hypothetical protein [Saccharomonospora saliphila]|uniref:hypothetical protein n=1 Tax=Saccharomonospora saliphila TaxID=369829 RepID=UPI000374B546|nr:hypothetical protein [Saccharomonospora saliphila]